MDEVWRRFEVAGPTEGDRNRTDGDTRKKQTGSKEQLDMGSRVGGVNNVPFT